jgi:hypothetical protein
MSVLTGGFDVALQLRQGAINRLFAAMHRSGSIDHRSTHVFHGKRIEVQIARPMVSLVPSLPPDGRPRALLRARVHFHSRALDDPTDRGVSASADVAVRATVWLPAGNPGMVDERSQIAIRWDETTPSDISVQGVGGPQAAEVGDAILDFLRRGGVRLGVPLPGGPAGGTASLGLKFIPGSDGEPVATIGLDLGGSARGSVAGIQQVFSGSDWALAFSRDYVLGSVRAAVQRSFGRLPAPLGASPVLIADERVCTLSAPIVGCIDYGQQQVVLEWLEIGLALGGVVVTGRVTQRNTAWYVPPVTASFTINLTVRFDQSARKLVVTADRPAVQIQQWYAQVFDFLSNRAMESAIREGVEEALLSGLGGDGLTSLFSSAVLQGLVTLGGSANVPVEAVVSAVETRPEGIVIHGSVQVLQMSAAPQANLRAYPSGRSPGGRLFHAGGSWAPGGEVVAYEWSFGDGQTAVSSGASISFTTEHEYRAAGTYQACVTVADADGRRATRCVVVRPQTLRLEHRITERSTRLPAPWRVCVGEGPVECEFVVLDEFAPVSGASVTLSAGNQCETGITDAIGAVKLTVRPEHFERIATTKKGSFAVGRMTVEAVKNGYAPASEVLAEIDCDSTRAGGFVDARRQLETWLERHVKFSLDPPGNRLDLDPRAAGLLADTGLVLDLLTRLFILVERGSEILPAERLLGLDTGDRPEHGRVVAKLGELLTEAQGGFSRAHDQLERMLAPQVGPDPASPGEPGGSVDEGARPAK